MCSHPAYMAFYPVDYIAATQHLTTKQHGAYLLLIMHYWIKGKLPTDDTLLARIAHMSAFEWAKNRAVLAEFFRDGWRHERVEKERDKALNKLAERAKFGKRGGIANALKNKGSGLAKATAKATAKALASSSEKASPLEKEAHSSPLSFVVSDQKIFDNVSVLVEKPKAKKPTYPDSFLDLWARFPRQPNASKLEAFKAWQKLDDFDRLACFNGALAYGKFLAAEREKRPDYPGLHLATFVNQRRWEGLLETLEPTKADGGWKDPFAEIEGSGPLVAVNDRVIALILNGYWVKAHGSPPRQDEHGTWLPKAWVEKAVAQREARRAVS